MFNTMNTLAASRGDSSKQMNDGDETEMTRKDVPFKGADASAFFAFCEKRTTEIEDERERRGV